MRELCKCRKGRNPHCKRGLVRGRYKRSKKETLVADDET